MSARISKQTMKQADNSENHFMAGPSKVNENILHIKVSLLLYRLIVF